MYRLGTFLPKIKYPKSRVSFGIMRCSNHANDSIFLVSQIWRIAACLGLTNTIYLNKKAVREGIPSGGNEISYDDYGT